jgi:hypothetical protein
MYTTVKNIGLALIAPAVSVGLLLPMAAQDAGRSRPPNVDAYHRQVKAAIEKIPPHLGTWVGEDQDVPTAAQKLLRPNIILSRNYTDTLTGAQVSLLIVHCRDPRDMLGHYPPICYPANGDPQSGEGAPRDWVVRESPSNDASPSRTISGMEYVFERQFRDPRGMSSVTRTTVVYNFLVVPDHRDTIRDMDALQRAAKDYKRRPYGAAQFQVVFSGEDNHPVPSREQRDKVFQALIGPNLPVIDTLINASQATSAPGENSTVTDASNTPVIPAMPVNPATAANGSQAGSDLTDGPRGL